MAQITEAEILKAYQTASEAHKNFIDSDELFDTFYEIRNTFNLHVDQAGNLALAIDAIILELRPFEQFPTLLKEALGTADDATLQKVLKEVNDKVFAVFRAKTKERKDAVDAAIKPVAAVPVVAPAAVPPVSTAPSAPTPTPPAAVRPLSVLESKMAATVAPTPMVEKVESPTPPTPATAPVAKAPPAPPASVYRKGDPYRELPE